MDNERQKAELLNYYSVGAYLAPEELSMINVTILLNKRQTFSINCQILLVIVININ